MTKTVEDARAYPLTEKFKNLRQQNLDNLTPVEVELLEAVLTEITARFTTPNPPKTGGCLLYIYQYNHLKTKPVVYRP